MFCFSIYRFSSIVSYTNISSLYKNRMHYCPNQSTTIMYRESLNAPQRTQWKVLWFMFAALSSAANTDVIVKMTILAVVITIKS